MKKYKADILPFLEANKELMEKAVLEDEQDLGLSKTQREIAKLAMTAIGYSPKTDPTTVYQALVKNYETRRSAFS